MSYTTTSTKKSKLDTFDILNFRFYITSILKLYVVMDGNIIVIIFVIIMIIIVTIIISIIIIFVIIIIIIIIIS